MLQGLYAAATGINAVEERQSVIANNIANSSTAGFRRQEAVQRGFYSVLGDEMATPKSFDGEKAPGGGVMLDETFTDLRNGGMLNTQDPLNVGLNGPGFLAVETAQGVRYTRAGRLSLDTENKLITADGYKVLGAGDEPISVPRGELVISNKGEIIVNGAMAGQLKLVEFDNPHVLTRQGQSLFVASEEMKELAVPGTKTTVVHKALEASNVNLPQEMIGMILGLRAYGACQKVINCIDETSQRLIEQVGTPS